MVPIANRSHKLSSAASKKTKDLSNSTQKIEAKAGLNGKPIATPSVYE